MSPKFFQYLFTATAVFLVISPFLVISRKCKPVLWRHVVLGYVLGGVMILAVWFIFVFLDKVIKDYTLWGAILDGMVYIEVWLSIILAVSPFFIARLRYGKLTKKRFIISLLLSTVLLCAVFVLWGYLMAWGLGKLTETL